MSVRVQVQGRKNILFVECPFYTWKMKTDLTNTISLELGTELNHLVRHELKSVRQWDASSINEQKETDGVLFQM